MRQLKFRFYDKLEEEMVHSNESCLAEFFDDYDNSMPNAEIMQFTGLLDKQGAEIYERDIVNLYFEEEYSNDCVLVESLTTKTVKVKLDYQGVYGEEIDSTWYYFPDLISNDVEIEVIGNIYENKYLLKD